MSKELVINIEDRKIGAFGVRGFKYGNSFVTKSGAEIMVKQGGDNVNPVFVAAMHAFESHEAGRYKKPMSVEAIYKAKKLKLDERKIPGEPERVEPKFDVGGKLSLERVGAKTAAGLGLGNGDTPFLHR